MIDVGLISAKDIAQFAKALIYQGKNTQEASSVATATTCATTVDLSRNSCIYIDNVL